MQFRETQPIYLQIAEYVCERILLKEWKEKERIPSVRELGVLLEVNPNTVMRTYDTLQQQDIIYNQRGIGFFAAESAQARAMEYLRSEFIKKDLPAFFRNMFLLDMKPEDLTTRFEEYKQKNYGKETHQEK